MIQVNETFDPVRYSIEENKFLLDKIGQPTSVALADGVPTGVTVAAVRPAIDRIYELIELEKHRGQEWVGIDRIKVAIQTYLDQQARWAADKRRFPRAPRFPSMHSFDGKNRPHRGGPGADSGQVRTYFDKSGNRIPFAVNLTANSETGGWVPEWTKAAVNTKSLDHDVDSHRYECPVCKHTESYKADSSASEKAALSRMSKHLRNDTTEVELHRELYTNVFGS